MRSVALLSIGLVFGAAAGAFGCSSTDNNTGSNESAAKEDQDAGKQDPLALGKAAIALISGENAHCNHCHTASRDDIRRWGDTMLDITFQCLTQPEAQKRIACLADDPNDPQSPFSPGKLGLLAAGVSFLEGDLMTVDPSGARLQAFKDIAMPRGTTVPAFTKEEFQAVMNWVFTGMEGFDELLGPPPEPDPCVPSISPALAEHVTKMKTQGWGARLKEASTPMYGCGAETNPLACLGSLPEITSTFGNPGVNQKLRTLRSMPKTNYWVRSSADGRFVGYGQNSAAGIVDLTTPPDVPPIAVDASYDPAFFPNNDGVSFAGTGKEGAIRVCRQSVLTNLASQPSPRLTLNEPGCTAIANEVYQSVGAALDGAVFWMSFGAHVNDDGGNLMTRPLPGFELNSATYLIPMVSDGFGFQPKPTVKLSTPLEGDQILSPSSQLLATRVGSKPNTRGFKIRQLTTTTGAGGAIGATTEVIGTICGAGAKASFSFDERFVVTHRYVDATDGSGLPEKSSNIVMTDLVTGEEVLLTKMPVNQYALYPHFRADGWLYFLVRDMNPNGTDTLVASDAALHKLQP